MCGIIGIYDPSGRATEERLRRMAQTIVHRGPNDEGFLVDGPVALGMRRLSIIDLEGGHQPISNERETSHIVFNGEIYNYGTLQADLRARGHRLRTRSDTETIVHEYEDRGKDCVHALNGMFAFAIWDGERERLFLARDRLGIKPLYYAWNGGTLVFGSEIKALLASGLVDATVCEEAIWHYLTFRYVPAPLTIWQGVRKLLPGHHLTVDTRTGEHEVQRYWDIRYTHPANGVGEAADDAFERLFLDSVKHRLIADVPVGIFLSGGLDSSCVAAAVPEVHNSSLTTFSVGYHGAGEESELAHAGRMARHLGCEHREVLIDEHDFVAFLPDLVWYTDEPLADPSTVPLYYLAELASREVKVVLSGEGADEVLGGYDFDAQVLAWKKVERFQRLPRFVRYTAPKLIMSALGASEAVGWLNRANIPLPDRNRLLVPQMSHVFSESDKQGLMQDEPGRTQASKEFYVRYFQRSDTRDPLHQLLYAACQDWLVEDLLMTADKMTMASSLELRVPFLDHRLVEWLASQPADVKIRRNGGSDCTTKYLLRRFARERLPEEILTRPKQGFPVPLRAWFAGRLGEFALERLLDRDAWTGPLLKRSLVEENVRSAMAGRQDAIDGAWLLLVLELWGRRWAGVA